MPSTPMPRRKVKTNKPNKPNKQTSKKPSAAATPSTTTAIQTSNTKSFVTEATPRKDGPIPLDLSSTRQGKSPDLTIRSISPSPALSTPTRPLTERPRLVVPFQKARFEHTLAVARVHRAIAAIRKCRAKMKRLHDLFNQHQDSANLVLLDASVVAASDRLVQAVEDDERTRAGNPPGYVRYPAEMIPELLASVEKAEADRYKWTSKLKRLRLLLDIISGGTMPNLKRILEAARDKMAALRTPRKVVQDRPEPPYPLDLPDGMKKRYPALKGLH
ncbi:hypothetical protein CTA2_11650 [Colletotrichum tanaceti]|uniref:Uncharacterized protein n=1 Tax=Colletotrichum tanaceti TaxID=1306861 RepID=A0A4U6XHJ3_9PEZI|nr:hypothetical protein CTA2_11650 [Colletotrichum tanaceti]TKW55211.1 hypothetical protein CTA1_9426 [Colletotrichum tanaceti]